MVGRQLDGHGPAKVVADHVGARETEVGAESVKEPAPVSYTVAGKGLVRLPETAQIQGIHREPLRQASRELLPEARRGEPTVHQDDRGPPAHDVVADQDPFQLQILRVAGALHLAGGAPEQDRGAQNQDHQRQHHYQYYAHTRHDSAKDPQQDTDAPRQQSTAKARIQYGRALLRVATSGPAKYESTNPSSRPKS